MAINASHGEHDVPAQAVQHAAARLLASWLISLAAEGWPVAHWPGGLPAACGARARVEAEPTQLARIAVLGGEQRAIVIRVLGHTTLHRTFWLNQV